MSTLYQPDCNFIPEKPYHNLMTKATAILYVGSFIQNYCRINKMNICQAIINLCIKIFYDKHAVSYRTTLEYLLTPNYVIGVYDFKNCLWKPAVYIHHREKKKEIIVRFIPIDGFKDTSFLTISDFPITYIIKKPKGYPIHYGFVKAMSNLPHFFREY